MPTRTETSTINQSQLLGIAHAERERLGRMIQFAAPESWEQPSAAEGWWNRDVMAHLAADDTAAAQLVAGLPAEELEEYRDGPGREEFDVDGWNAWTVNRRSGLEVRDVLDTWGRAAGSLLEHAVRLSDDDWADRRHPWIAGDIATRFLIQSRVVEWFLHGEDMRATNGVATGWQLGWQHWPVHLTIDLGVRMLPWALEQGGHDLSGRSVLVDVDGAGAGSWHWALGAGDVPPSDKAHDAVISGRAPQLALVAGRRLAADEVLSSGKVVLGGDRQLADLVLRTLRAYP